MTAFDLRDSIFSLHTRKFGGIVEKLVERILVEFGFIVNKPKNLSYDREINKMPDEIKGSRVFVKSKLDLNKDNIIEEIINHKNNTYINFDNIINLEWDCNIQQIKTKLFNNLWYVLFFGDCVVIFKINNEEILSDKTISYSNKQHRGNEGEGQFHVNEKNINYHIDKYLVKILTYDEVYDKLSKNSKINE